MDSTATDRLDTNRFEASRNRLASLAYQLLNSAADAEDTVQDAFLHWQPPTGSGSRRRKHG
ncbi:sigma factor [Nonomuraea solani]|uniref:sigma factor n=1 Tax=Nonomuraea solani TaxID=1144553 RepID=UPI001F384FF0|nr:sigma factor [Nonomuraea solani]